MDFKILYICMCVCVCVCIHTLFPFLHKKYNTIHTLLHVGFLHYYPGGHSLAICRNSLLFTIDEYPIACIYHCLFTCPL